MSIINRLLNQQGASVVVLLLGCLLLGPWNSTAVNDAGLMRSALRAGEYWRFFTGPLVHSSWPHLGLNMAALLMLQQLFGAELRAIVWLWGYAFITVISGICFLAFSRYGVVEGLSGVLHGLFAYAACLAVRRDALLAAGVLLLLAGKVVWEQLVNPSGLVERLINMPVATDMHLYGAIAGAVLGAIMAASATQSLRKA